MLSSAIDDTGVGRLQAALAAELRRVGQLIEGLAETLVGDAHFAERYLDQLQAFDLLVQCADESARVLDRLAGGQAPDAAIAPVRVGAVQERLRDALVRAA